LNDSAIWDIYSPIIEKIDLTKVEEKEINKETKDLIIELKVKSLELKVS
jgi:uncharacterized protein (UPF0335 family)